LVFSLTLIVLSRVWPGAEIADLKAQLAAAIQRIDKLEHENSRLCEENAQLKQQLAAARKNSSTSSKPPSSRSSCERLSHALWQMGSGRE